MSSYVPVRYYTSSTSRDGGYVFVFKAIGAGSEPLNNNICPNRVFGTGRHPVGLRTFASDGGVFPYRGDCRTAARRFRQQYGVRTMIMCLPWPVKYGQGAFHFRVVRVREHRRAVIIRWMLGAKFRIEVAEIIAAFLVGRKLTSLSYTAWLQFD